jgi:outer membrane protein OmpA-like peptidoglycan-associated protein
MISFKKTSVTLMLVSLFILNANAQSGLIKEATRQFDMMSYANAIDLFEKALKKPEKIPDALKLSVKTKLANSYRLIKDTQNAERVYREVIGNANSFTGEDSKTVMYYAQALASNGKYRESQEAFQKYMSVQTDDQRKGFLKIQSTAEKLQKNASSYKIEYLTMNSGKADFSPTYYKNGMIFCSNRGEGGIAKRVFCWDNSAFLDLYFLPDLAAIGGQGASSLGGGSNKAGKLQKAGRTLGNDEYTSPTANDSRTVGTYGGIAIAGGGSYDEVPQSPSNRFSKDLNTKYHEGPAVFTNDAKKVIFTRNNFNNGKYKISSDGVNKLKIYTADDKTGGWANVKEVPFNSNEYSTGHPSITKDDKLVYFVSDMPGGFGGTDIYVVSYNNDSWGTPVNLGKTINTKGNEMFPYVDANNNLYFSSDGHPGLGDLDIFYVDMKNGTPIGRVRNLGAPMNSSKDDFGIITDAERKTGYFSSNRKRGGTDDDIYRFNREGSLWPCSDLIAVVYDAETKMPIEGATVSIDGNGKVLDSKTTDNEGAANVCVDESGEMIFNASKSGYTANKVTYTAKGDDAEESGRIEIALTKIKADTVATNTGGIGESTEQPVNGSANGAYSNNGGTSTNIPLGKGESIAGKAGTIKGKLKRQRTGEPIEGAVVTLRNDRDGSIQQVVTGPDGSYEFDVLEGNDYTLEASKDGYGTKGRKIRKVKAGQAYINGDMTMFETGDVIALENIYYDLNSAKIRLDAQGELTRLVEMMRKYPRMRIEFRSHTDSRGDANANQMLSEKRTKCAIAWMKKKGIRSSRFVPMGFGESQLVNNCADGVECTEEMHQQNRRTEIKILQMK